MTHLKDGAAWPRVNSHDGCPRLVGHQTTRDWTDQRCLPIQTADPSKLTVKRSHESDAMDFSKKLFRPKQQQSSDEPLVPIFIPPPVVVLRAAEQEKEAPLDDDEVMSIRDKAVCMVVRQSAAQEMEAKRGYADISAENAWEDWRVARPNLSAGSWTATSCWSSKWPAEQKPTSHPRCTSRALRGA